MRFGMNLLLSLPFFFPSLLPAQPYREIFREPLSDRIVNYDIQVALDDTQKTLAGTLHLSWRNPSSDTIPDLQFHLYYNGFRDAKSTLSRERKARIPWAKGGWGWVDVTALSVRGRDQTGKIRFIAPDDGNPDDRTVMQVPLDEPVQPREQLDIEVKFTAKIPRNHMRTGWWGDDFFFMAQWFPKIGVYEPPGMRLVPPDARRGRWNCHQFHASTEFYADFGIYKVAITLPQKYTVASSGLIHHERLNEDGSKTVFASAEDVHDFAWLADASVLDIEDEWRSNETGQRVRLRLLLQPGHELARTPYFESAKYALQYFERWLGENAYPYPQLTIVDPQPGSGAGGMEYPTLITGDVFYPLRVLSRGGIHDVEMVTIHEFAHQYWYGMVANNEFEEAFLDEGFTTYTENRIGAALFGKRRSLLDFLGLQASLEAVRRPAYAFSKSNRDGTLTEPTFAARGGSNLAYNKWSLAMKTLDNLLGRDRFDTILRTYFRRWRFKHPCRNDFIAVANEVAGEDLSWFFDQIISGDGVVDYGIAEIRSVPLRLLERRPDASRHENGQLPPEGADTSGSAAPETERYESTVVIHRLGDVSLPVEILIEFSGGRKVTETWDGHARFKKFIYSPAGRVRKVVIDPELKIPLDINLVNNSVTRPHAQVLQKVRWKWFFWMQSLLALLASIA